MTTTIVPASGQGALFTQQGPGTTPGYSALDERRSNSGALQEGVYGTPTLVTAGGVPNVANADFMVTQRNAGANQSVDINMPGGGFAFVQGDTINGQGLYCVPVHSANINEAIAAADATNPRVDQVILEVQDNVLDASGGNLARVRVLTGTATASASLTNRFGAVALPGSALLLADVLVPNASSSVPNTNIRDRRKWARGAFVRQIKSDAVVSTASLSSTPIDTSRLQARIECSGVPMRVSLQTWGYNATAGDGVATGVNLDSAALDGFGDFMQGVSGASTSPEDLSFSYVTTPTAGTHVFAPTFRAVTGGTANLTSDATRPCVLVIEELVRANGQNNNGVTTG